jgi:hypothetical protein
VANPVEQFLGLRDRQLEMLGRDAVRDLARLREIASMNPASGARRIACATSSCSAWEKRSIAIQSGSVEPSQITRISDGPATISIPTVPKTRRFAAAT